MFGDYSMIMQAVLLGVVNRSPEVSQLVGPVLTRVSLRKALPT